jgi:uncharacterized protein (DUF697 family)
MMSEGTEPASGATRQPIDAQAETSQPTSEMVPIARSDIEVEATIATGEMDTFILDQAMLAAACELLPDRLATLTVLPIQVRLVYTIGQRAGQEFGIDQAGDLVATLGLGAAAQAMERVVRGTLGSVAGGLFGGLLGNATGIAAGAAVTFASTYALGHAAERYYAQGRQLSTADMRTLIAQFQNEAKDIFPRVEARIRELASGNQLDAVLKTIRGT